MTFSLLLQRPRTELLIGASRHAEFNAAMPNRVRWTLRRSNWTCNHCGAHLPNLMEIDHFDEHGPGPGGRIAPICQFCHDLKHPLWAAARHRLVPVALPEMDQTTFTRLCWIMLSRSFHDEQGAEPLRPVIRTLAHRRLMAKSTLGTLNMTEAFEALLAVADREGATRASAVAGRLDACVRMMPGAILDPSALCAWTGGGFEPVRLDALREATQRPLPPDEAAAILAEARSFAVEACGAGADPLPKTCPEPPAAAGDGAEDAAGCGADPDPLPETRPERPADAEADPPAGAGGGAEDAAGCGADPDPLPEFHPERPADTEADPPAGAGDGVEDAAGCGADPDPMPEFHPERPAGDAALAMAAAAAAPEGPCAVAPGCPAQAGPPPASEPARESEEEGMAPWA